MKFAELRIGQTFRFVNTNVSWVIGNTYIVTDNNGSFLGVNGGGTGREPEMDRQAVELVELTPKPLTFSNLRPGDKFIYEGHKYLVYEENSGLFALGDDFVAYDFDADTIVTLTSGQSVL